MELKGQIALVTGGGSGIGRAMALGLAGAGADILIADARPEAAEEVAGEIHALGSTAETFIGDIADAAIAGNLIEYCLSKMGGIHILINNAGLRMETRDDGVYEDFRCLRQRPTQDVPLTDWDRLMAINLRAPFILTQKVLPHLITQGHGTIINVSSGAGSNGVAGKSAYCASKHGIEGLTKAVAEEVRDHGISVNAVYPGGRANVDGRGGADPEIIIPLVNFLCAQNRPEVTGQAIEAKVWNAANGFG